MSKRVQIREERRKQQRRNQILWIGVTLLVLAAVLALVLPNMINANASVPTANLVQPEEKPFPNAQMNTLGSPDAPVKVVGFADYLCSHCQVFVADAEASFIERYVETGKVYYEYQSVAFINPSQTLPIEATYCAGDQDAFWPFRDLAYTNVVANPSALNDNYLRAYATKLNLDMNEFNDCLRSGKQRPKVQEALSAARAANIPGTPTFLVNGTEASRLNLSEVVDSELAKLGITP